MVHLTEYKCSDAFKIYNRIFLHGTATYSYQIHSPQYILDAANSNHKVKGDHTLRLCIHEPQ